ncbi:hypothetical protein [Autumnicola edwardsiae]|uniref:Uncharacterized protein n=1 Tax=Autumnicola edwardsiae TaxID=3075594 RepID=A0ABU3CTC7_9FLAO|nr:hypothetical protein [Zunongwangia sp. F297]MDT0649611.1 hypothetical protein [Zunongwangia sp. F297]
MNQKKNFFFLKNKIFSHIPKERFRNYNTPWDIRDNYLSDLSSQTAKKKNAELKDLNLPRLPYFKDQFLELCDKLGVK